MKSMPLLACIPFLLPGCLEVDYIQHDIEITLKDGVPCFSPLSDDKVRKEQVEIYGAGLGKVYAPFPDQMEWTKGWEINATLSLSGDECLIYGGDTPLEKNILYGFGFSVLVKGQKQKESHLYGTVFCLSDKKNGETVIQQFSDVEDAKVPPTDSLGDAIRVHNVTVSLRDNIPCFSLADDEQARNKEILLYYVGVVQFDSDETSGLVWKEHWGWENKISLHPGECLPYRGDVELKKNVMYGVDLDASADGLSWEPYHFFNAAFCLSEDRNSKISIHQFPKTERPSTCPSASDK
jgi:hypothetical protein